MRILLLVLLGYALLFYPLKRAGVNCEPGETLIMLGEIPPFVIPGVPLVNWLVGTELSNHE